MTSSKPWTVPAVRYDHAWSCARVEADKLRQALLGGLQLVADLGESFMEDVLIGVCDISGVRHFSSPTEHRDLALYPV